MTEDTSLALRDNFIPALRNAISLWANATTDAASSRREDLLRDKRRAIEGFFTHAGKHPAEVTPVDVRAWQASLAERGLQPATIYWHVSRLSSFFSWAMQAPGLREEIGENPVRLARPKSPKAYQTASARSLDDEQLAALVGVIKQRADAGDVIGKRDYALLLFFAITGMRRQEVIVLRGSDLELKPDRLLVRAKVKGGDYQAREVREPLVREALLDYLKSAGREAALKHGGPLWTRHDRCGPPGAPLTSHAFALNLKRYADQAGIGKIHLHQLRHTFARIVAEESGSLHETQEALGHKNLQTTRIYVQRIAVRRDKHGSRIARRLGVRRMDSE